MSKHDTDWIVETKPVVSAPIPAPEALVERAARRPHREQSENPILRRLSPRRNYWPDVAAYDERGRELQLRVAALNDEIARREQALVRARAADREALTRWQLEDGKGERPQPTVPAIEQEIAAKKADRDAALAASERVFDDKAAFVEKNRRRIVRDADKATADARARYERALEQAEQARAELVAAREASLWASFFPGELQTQQPDMAAVATNLRKPVEAALQVRTRLGADGVFAVLRSDAGILATAMTREQAVELGVATPDEGAVAKWEGGKPDYVGPNFGAAWAGTPEEKEQAAMIDRYTAAVRKRLRGDQ